MLTGGKLLADVKLLKLMAKSKKLDHSELDKSYFLKKMKNESKVVDQKQDLREAKQRLRDFESNMEEELPSLKKLKDFRAIAKEMIENPKGKSRKLIRRSKRETEELHEKLKEFASANPGVDVTTLFESEKTEKLKREMHKRAFSSYKRFEFLKAGIDVDKPDKKEAFRRNLGLAEESDAFEPFNYPPLRESVARILRPEIQPRMLDVGEPMKAPGRRFSYSKEEFLEAYLGRDYARAVDH